MYKLKLTKGRSYRGGFDGRLKATKENPLCTVETQEEADFLLSTGYFSQDVVEPQKAKTEEELKAKQAGDAAAAGAAATEAAYKERIEKLGLNNDDLTRDQYSVALYKLNRADVDKYATGLGLDVGKAKNKDDVITLVLNLLYPTGQQSEQNT